MANSECSISYHRAKIDELETFAVGVKSSYYTNNPPFATHAVPLAQFEAAIMAYVNTYGKYASGGKLQKGNFLIAKNALIKALDTIKDDVNKVAQGKETIIMEGGFKPTKTTRSDKNVPPTPEVEKLRHATEGAITAQCNMLGAEIYYGCIISEGAPLDPAVKMVNGTLIIPAAHTTAIRIDENKSRKKSFMGLKPGTRYYVYFFARNSAGVSGLSETRSIICG